MGKMKELDTKLEEIDRLEIRGASNVKVGLSGDEIRYWYRYLCGRHRDELSRESNTDLVHRSEERKYG